MMIFPVGLLFAARYMPRKTAKGARAAVQWNAFKNYLKNIEKYAQVKDAQDQFEKYLPYAIAFGLEKSWVKKTLWSVVDEASGLEVLLLCVVADAV